MINVFDFNEQYIHVFDWQRLKISDMSPDSRAMDQLEQRCHDLDAKVRRVEEERDAVMVENDELHDKIAVIAQVRSVSKYCRAE